MIGLGSKSIGVRVALEMLLGTGLAGCQLDGSTPGTSTRPTSVTARTPGAVLSISGIPTTTVLVGDTFRFQPQIHAAAGASLRYSTQNLPSWMSFNYDTGMLMGKPTAAEVGTYPNIKITVSDGVRVAALPSFALLVEQTATSSAALSWSIPTQNADGTPLTDLVGYHIYIGAQPNALDRVVTIPTRALTDYVVTSLTSGTWYFAIRSFNSSNIESDLSPTLSAQI